MKFVFLIFFAAGGFFISGCRSPNWEASRTSVDTSKTRDISPLDNLDSEKRAEAFARFATGISYEITDQPNLAQNEFYQAVLADPSNEPLVLTLSQRFLKKGEPEKAIEVLSQSAALPEASGSISAWLSRAYLAAGKTNLAIKASRSAIKRSPDLISGYQTLTEIFLRTGQVNEAVKLLNSATHSTNSDALFLINLSGLYETVLEASPKEPDAVKHMALSVLNRAAALHPGNPNLRQKLADTFAHFGETTQAAEIYLQLLAEFHDADLMRDALREKLANLYLRNRDRTKAVEQLEAVVRDNPTRYPQAWYYLGAFAYDAEDYAKAADYFNRALIVNPDLEQAYYELASLQIHIKQAGEALKTLEKARKKFPRSFNGEFLTGLAHSHLKNYSDAVKYFSAAEMVANLNDPRRLNHLFYFQMGAACERNHDYPQAETCFKKSLEIAPDFSDALNYLGFMWADRGENLDKAREMIEKAVKLEPKNAAYLDSLGWVLFKLNRNKQALEFLLESVALSEEPDPSIFDHVGDVYRALNENEKARQAWQKSLSLEPNDDVRKKLQAISSAL